MKGLRVGSIDEVRAALDRGEITREEFWSRMRQAHLRLGEHQRLIANSEVSEIRITAEELTIATSDGTLLAWQPEDLRTAPNVLVNTGEYEPLESAALARAAAGARLICDIGANIGYYSNSWARNLAPGGRVHSFEPVPSTYSRLVRNIALNGLQERVIAKNCGLGDKVATLTMYVPAFSGSGAASLMNLHQDEGSLEVQVPVDTLDRYFRANHIESFDLAKIDVEGAELLVVKGGADAIRTHRPLLFLELLRKWSKPFGYHPNDLIALLHGWGYGCFAFTNGALAPFNTMTDDTTQTNFFFAHPDRHRAWLAAHGC
jgi:FkbM family methyltransferase